MARAYNGQIHIRVAPAIHEEVAKEAFDRGTSISGICAEALAVRRLLKDLEPWKAVERIWADNKNHSSDEIEADIAEAINSVRNEKRERK